MNIYFNTSHVNVNRQQAGYCMQLKHNFNTSHVNVNQLQTFIQTSLVLLFQYISC